METQYHIITDGKGEHETDKIIDVQTLEFPDVDRHDELHHIIGGVESDGVIRKGNIKRLCDVMSTNDTTPIYISIDDSSCPLRIVKKLMSNDGNVLVLLCANMYAETDSIGLIPGVSTYVLNIISITVEHNSGDRNDWVPVGLIYDNMYLSNNNFDDIRVDMFDNGIGVCIDKETIKIPTEGMEYGTNDRYICMCGSCGIHRLYEITTFRKINDGYRISFSKGPLYKNTIRFTDFGDIVVESEDNLLGMRYPEW